MAARSLLRTEAAARAAGLRIRHTRVELDLTDPQAPTFGSTSEIGFSSTTEASFADFHGVALEAAELNGVPLDPGTWTDGRIPLPGLQPENVLRIHGRMAYSTAGEGLHRHVDPADGETYLYAMSFLDAAPAWFGCFDQPDLKSRYEFVVHAPADWTVLGNGPSVVEAPGRWRIVPLQVLSTYFVTLVAGPYASVFSEHSRIRLGVHARASLRDELEAQAPEIFAVTGQCFDYYHRIFDAPYAFGEYHQAFVPDFNAGAMENPGCVTFRDQLIFRGQTTHTDRARRAGVIAHEMAHQWFGDLVTLRWWDDLWLNESFAEYLAHRCCTEATEFELWTDFGLSRKEWGSIADQSPSTHPVAGTGAADAAGALADFDGISYAKGAAVLRQLVAFIGDDTFLAGLNSYFENYGFGNASFVELIGQWTAAGATGLDDWAQAWLRTSGMDRIDVIEDAGRAYVSRTPAPGGADRVHAIEIAAVAPDGTVSVIAQTRLADDPFVVEPPAGTTLLVPDCGDATWAKIRFGDWAAAASVAPRIAESAPLVVVINAMRDAVRDADLDPRDALDLVAAVVPGQTSEAVLNALLGFASGTLAGPYAPVAERPARLRRVFDLATRAAASASPDADDPHAFGRLLTAYRAMVRTCADPAQLRRWWAGENLPTGIALDRELRWAITVRVAGLEPAEELIAQTEATDRSAAGRAYATRARAAQPAAEAKERAWRLIMQPSDVTTYEVYAACEGFFDPGQSELTASYVARYFTEIGDTAGFRSGWALGRVASLLFPASAATPETLALAEVALAAELAQPVERAIIDEADQLRRAVASMQRFR